jgi:hemerythrin-like domain-containing protein
MPASKSKTHESDTPEHQDAIELLTTDHDNVKALFQQFDELTEQEGVDEQKAQLVEQICNELTVHAQLEEEIFYPAVREAIDDDDIVDEADVEHATAKDLISQLEGMSPGDDHYDATVTVLGEYINHHVDEEEGEMFEQARASDLDTGALGAAIAARKLEVMAEMGIDDEVTEDDDLPPVEPAKVDGAAKSRSPARK